MKHALALLLCLPALAQISSFPPTGGTGVGAANLTSEQAGPATTATIDISSLSLTTATQNTLLVLCYTGTGFSGGHVTGTAATPLAISSLNPRSLTSVTANFSSSSNVYCVANSNGGAGATGATGAAGAPGAAGAQGAKAWTAAAAWNSGTAYTVTSGQPTPLVTYQGQAYEAAASSTNVTPGTDGTKWTLVAARPGRSVGPTSFTCATTPCTLTITHSLGTTAAILYLKDGTGLPIIAAWTNTDGDTITVTFATPQSGTYVVIGPDVYAPAGGGSIDGLSSNGSLVTASIPVAAPNLPLSLLAYGGNCNGTFDNATAFAAAQTALPATGGIIELPPGVCRFDSAITVNKRVIIRGAGNTEDNTATSGTVWLKHGNFTAITFSNGAATLQGITVKGDTGNGGVGVAVETPLVTLRDSTVINMASHGIRIGSDSTSAGHNSNLWRLDNVTTRGNGGHGVFCDDSDAGATSIDANAGQSYGLFTYGNGGDGLQIARCQVNQWFGVNAENNTGIGVHVTGANAKYNYFPSAHSEGNTGGDFIYDSGTLNNMTISSDNAAVVDNGTNTVLQLAGGSGQRLLLNRPLAVNGPDTYGAGLLARAVSGSNLGSLISTADYNNTSTGTSLQTLFGANSGNTYAKLQAATGAGAAANVEVNPFGNTIIGHQADSGEKLQVVGTAKVTGTLSAGSAVLGPYTLAQLNVLTPPVTSLAVVTDSSNCTSQTIGQVQLCRYVSAGTWAAIAAGTAANVPFTQAGTSAVARTVDAALKTTRTSVKDFGAVCNATTDDTAAIQLAVDAFSIGEPIEVRGICKITGTITIAKHGVALHGGSPLKDGFLYAPTSNDSSMFKIQGTYPAFPIGVLFDGVGMYGGGDCVTPSGCTLRSGSIAIWTRDASQLMLRNVRIYDWYFSDETAMGLKYEGREWLEMSQRTVIFANRPLVILRDPDNVTRGIGNDADYVHLNDVALGMNNGSIAHPCVEIGDNVAMQNSVFENVNLNDGSNGIYSSGTTGSFVSYAWTFRNIRWEGDNAPAGGYVIYLAKTGTSNKLYNLRLENITARTGNNTNGVYLRSVIGGSADNLQFTYDPPAVSINVDSSVTNFEWAGNQFTAGTVSGVTIPSAKRLGYAIQAGAANTAALTDASNVVFGCIPSSAALGGTGTTRCYMPAPGKITAAFVHFWNGGTLGTSETSTAYIRLNNSTNTAISASCVNDAAQTVCSSTSLSITIAAGDYFEILWVTPTWATNPTNVRLDAVVYIE